MKYFNPRTPCGVRLFDNTVATQAGRFQSTHPVWGATGRNTVQVRVHNNFNPRTPCGVRHVFPS